MQVQTRDARSMIAGLRVVVVDDVMDCRDLVELYLKQMEAKVEAVDSAQKALDIMDDFQPELVIADIYLPGRDGYWLIEELKRLNAKSQTKVKTIALTAAAKEEDRLQLIAAGYDGYLSKPFFFEDLTELINRLITQ